MTNFQSADLDFCKVSIRDFYRGKTIPYELYIRVNDAKYLKIAHANEAIGIERLRQYRERGISFLYLTSDDFRKYLGFTLGLVKTMEKVSEVTVQKRVDLVRHGIELLLEGLYTGPLKSEYADQAFAILESTLKLLAESNEGLEILEAICKHSDRLYGHSLGVSLYSLIVGQELGWEKEGTLFKLATGALLHDVGKRWIPASITEKSAAFRTGDENAIYETHAAKGAEMLAKTPGFSDEVVQIVLQHHERNNRTGYPSKLAGKAIAQMAKIVGVVNEFCEYLLIETGLGEKPTVELLNKALKKVKVVVADGADPEIFAALTRAVTGEGKKRGSTGKKAA